MTVAKDQLKFVLGVIICSLMLGFELGIIVIGHIDTSRQRPGWPVTPPTAPFLVVGGQGKSGDSVLCHWDDLTRKASDCSIAGRATALDEAMTAMTRNVISYRDGDSACKQPLPHEYPDAGLHVVSQER